MTDDEIKSIAVNHLYKFNTDFSKYSEIEQQQIRKAIVEIEKRFEAKTEENLLEKRGYFNV